MRTESKKFEVRSNFPGYINKTDITNVDPRFLVSPSKNVIINDGEKIAIRGGIALDGPAGATSYPIQSSYDWITSTNSERNLRSYYDVLQYRYVDSLGTVTWKNLKSGFGDNVKFNFAEWYDSTTEKEDFLILVNGTADAFMWTGAITTIASVGTNTLTMDITNGPATWAEARFLTAGTRQVVILGVTYTYTGGESTATLTGVTPDPAVAAPSIAAGDIVHQQLRTTSNLIAATFYPGIVYTMNNYLFVADLNRRDIYSSKNTSYTDFTAPTSPRLPGEAAQLKLDSNPVGFETQDDLLYVWGSKNDIYQIKYTLSGDLTKEAISIFPLNRNPGQGALAQESIGKVKNAVFYFTNEKTFDSLSRVQDNNVPATGTISVNFSNVPKLFPISDPVEIEFKGFNYTISPHVKYFQYKTYCLIPSDSIMMIYDHRLQCWNPPQTIEGRRFAIIDGNLCVHSNSSDTTYTVFSGTSDNGNPINAWAYFAYENNGRRDWKKNHTEWYTEGYIASNTKLTSGFYYEYGGSRGILEFIIDPASNSALLFTPAADASLGKKHLGSNPLGSTTIEQTVLSKFREIKQMKKVDYFEVQKYYGSNEVDYQWELLAHGGNATLSTADNNFIKD